MDERAVVEMARVVNHTQFVHACDERPSLAHLLLHDPAPTATAAAAAAAAAEAAPTTGKKSVAEAATNGKSFTLPIQPG